MRRGALCLVRPDGTGRLADAAARRRSSASVRSTAPTSSTPWPINASVEVRYQHGVQNVLDLLARGEADAAVLIRPTSIDEIRRTAIERLLMPPKSTFFTPKLRPGW